MVPASERGGPAKIFATGGLQIQRLVVQPKWLSAEEKKKGAGFCEHSLLSSVVDWKELKAF
jgi:hypothetical protein